MNKEVHVFGAGGLGNCLSQIAVAINYAEKFGYKIILSNYSSHLHYGTANYTNRHKIHRKDGHPVSYKDSFYNTPRLTFTNIPSGIPYQIIHNDFSDSLPIPTSNYLRINGYSQNFGLYKDILPKMHDYFNLNMPDISKYIQEKYNIQPGVKNIMLGVRICNDFKHMNKIGASSYANALAQCVTADETDYNLIVITDTLDGLSDKLNFPIRGRIIIIDEDDICLFQAGMLCNHFILSESTYHYWIALLKYAKDPSVKVVLFNNTDLTNRNMNAPDWITIDY
jgi:hypothetical protein